MSCTPPQRTASVHGTAALDDSMHGQQHTVQRRVLIAKTGKLTLCRACMRVSMITRPCPRRICVPSMVWPYRKGRVQDVLVAAAHEVSGMPLPQLRSHVAALDKQLEEERKHNPFVAVVEESIQQLLNPDDLAQARGAMLSHHACTRPGPRQHICGDDEVTGSAYPAG